jgi:transcriptional regulator GlxA family with amidase domain
VRSPPDVARQLADEEAGPRPDGEEPRSGLSRIAILLYDGVDLLDSGGPYEVFLTAARLAVRDGAQPPFEVVTITPGGGPVAAYGGLLLTPHADAGAIGEIDVLIVPGTTDIDRALEDEALLASIERVGTGAAIVASVCTGAFLLAKLGLLADRAWTTHWEDVDLLAQTLDPAGARRDVRWVSEGAVTTAAGLSSGIAMSLHLVDRLAGRELAERTARQLDYDWDPTGRSTRGVS